MPQLSDSELERYCQARAVNGKPEQSAPGRDHMTALAYASGVIGHGSQSKKAHIAEKLQRFRGDVAARLSELGGPADNLHKGI